MPIEKETEQITITMCALGEQWNFDFTTRQELFLFRWWPFFFFFLLYTHKTPKALLTRGQKGL